MRTRTSTGFTLIELLVTLTVLVVLVVIAIPSFATFLQSQRIKNASMDLSSTVIYARSEAIKRNATVVISADTNGWSKGWVVSSGSDTIRSYTTSDHVSITASSSGSLSFGGDGRMLNDEVSFQIQPVETGSKQSPLCLTVRTTGRVQSTTGACS